MNNLESLLVFMAVGLVAGWLAGMLFKGGGFGMLGDLLAGIVGAQFGGWIFAKSGLAAYGFTGAIVFALLGAAASLAILRWAANRMTTRALFSVLLLLAFANSAQAATTVTVDNNDQVTVNRPGGYDSDAVSPAAFVREVPVRDFEGRIVEMDFERHLILVLDTDGRDREVAVKPELINNYRIGDYVYIRPSSELTVISLEENPRDFEGMIIRVDTSNAEIVVQDTNGRERRVQLRQGKINNYKVDDYVRVHLMSNLQEAENIETIRDVRNLEGSIVGVDVPRSQIVVRGKNDKDNTVLVRQGQINNYRIGDRVRIYLLANHDQVQVIRVIR